MTKFIETPKISEILKEEFMIPLGISAYRTFSTSVPLIQTSPGMLIFGTVTALGMMGGIYYLSSSLKVCISELSGYL